MKKWRTKKVAAVVVASALGLGMAGGALAYFTSSGTGTGSANVGSSTAFVIASSPATGAAALYPDPAIGGANIQTVAYTVHNPSAGSQNLTHVVVEVTPGYTFTDVAGDPACTAADFSVGGQAVGTSWTDNSMNGEFTAGQTSSSSVTVELIDNSANQDSCEGQTIPLTFTAS